MTTPISRYFLHPSGLTRPSDGQAFALESLLQRGYTVSRVYFIDRGIESAYRGPMEQNKTLLQTLKKIPIFKGLSPSQVKKVLGLCQSRACAPGDVVCARGTDSDEMYILIAGELGVKGEDRVLLATLQPITTVGEMGIFNRQRRSASVEVLKQSKVLVIARGPFESMLRSDLPMRVNIYKNIVEILSGKIVNDNVRARDYVLERVRSQKDQRAVEKKLAVAVALLAEKSGIEVEEAQILVDECVVEEKLRILIVDDEPAVRQLVQRLLTAYEVSEAGDGEKALVAIRADQPDLVIADIQMPRMDGFALVDQLKEEFPDIPVLALSGYVGAEEIEAHNFVGLIEKPMQINDFQERVDDTLDKSG